MKIAGVIVLLLLVFTLYKCDFQDSDYYPYSMQGFNVYVYDKDGKEYFAGFVDSGYSERYEGKERCRADALNFANEQHLGDDFGYVCCTVTSSSNCVTKVR